MSKIALILISLLVPGFAAQADMYVIRGMIELERRDNYRFVQFEDKTKIKIDCSSYFYQLTAQNGERNKTYYLSEEDCHNTINFFVKASWQKRCLALFDDHYQYGTCK